MRKIICLFAAFVLNISCTKAQEKQFSEEALAQKLVSHSGKEISLKDILKQHEGKTIVMEAWASWCSDCVKNMPKLKELQAENPEVAFVFLSADKTTEAWKVGIEKHAITGDHYLMPGGMKGDFGKAINLDWIPRYIIIDKTGKVKLYRAIETDHEKVSTLLKTLGK
ncbi:MAG: TlpA family protein disulfide reductase [Flavobacterium sp.]|nr:TlpA family protein disulfide reductase [Flavobacterium sp.]